MVITLKPSRLFSILALLLCGFAISILVWVVLPLWVKAILALLALLPVYRLWQMARLQGSDTILSLKPEGHGHWIVATPKGERRVWLVGDSIVTQQACILLFQQAGKRFVSIVLPDAVSKEEYRRLLVALRFV